MPVRKFVRAMCLQVFEGKYTKKLHISRLLAVSHTLFRRCVFDFVVIKNYQFIFATAE
jgi:hypothetical protein